MNHCKVGRRKKWAFNFTLLESHGRSRENMIFIIPKRPQEVKVNGRNQHTSEVALKALEHLYCNSTKPGPVNRLENTLPNFAQPGFQIAPFHISF